VAIVQVAASRRSSLEEIHQREVDPLSGQRVDDPRTAGGPDTLASSAAADINRCAGDEAFQLLFSFSYHCQLISIQ